jgi:hypothetical protein
VRPLPVVLAGSGVSDRYAVTMDTDRCWRAVRPRGAPKPLRGCRQVLDFAWPR